MPSLYKALIPISKAYVNAAGYRKVGLKYDDLIIEERRDVEKVRRFGRKGRARQSVTPNDAEWLHFDTALLRAPCAYRIVGSARNAHMLSARMLDGYPDCACVHLVAV